jgi:HJR/Mrr/RecB family endonuclease
MELPNLPKLPYIPSHVVAAQKAADILARINPLDQFGIWDTIYKQTRIHEPMILFQDLQKIENLSKKVNNFASININLDSTLFSIQEIKPVVDFQYQTLYQKFSQTNHLLQFWERSHPLFAEYEENADNEPGIILLDEAAKTKQIITDVFSNNDALYTIQPREFEELIAYLLREKGYAVELTKRTRDGGYDMMALRVLEGNINLKLLVEAKLYREDRKVGIEIIRSFKEVVSSENANMGLIVTSSYFTQPAKAKVSATPYILDLRDKNDVITWVNDYVMSK